MEYGKGILFLSIVFCLLLGMTSVCAGDSNDTAMAAVDAQDNLEIGEDDYVVEVDDDINGSSGGPQEDISEPNIDSDKSKAGNDLLQSACGDEMDILGEDQTGNYGSLQELINGANAGDVITLDRNYSFTDDLTKKQSEGVVIDKGGLTIDGNGYTIDACGKSRIFNIKSDVKLINIHFINAYSKKDGGAIYIKGKSSSYYFMNCSFEGNSAKNGGAICISDKSSSYYFMNCSFEGNSAKGGGAIYISGKSSSYYFMNCSFEGNSAKCGGAIYINCKSSSYLMNCSFVNNSAFLKYKKTAGGAIYSKSAIISLIDCSLVNNTATAGAAVWAKGSKNSFSVVNCSFVNNSAGTVNKKGFHLSNGDGGAIYLASSAGSFVGCSFVENSATGNGGAIFIKGKSNAFSFMNCSFANNFVRGIRNAKSIFISAAGAIYLDAGSASVIGCSFVNNSASGSGGAIWAKFSKDFTVENSSFVNNFANGSAKNENGGGAIYVKKSKESTVVNCSFVNNSVVGIGGVNDKHYSLGGALYLIASSGSFVDCTFADNSANAPDYLRNKFGACGGAIYVKFSKVGDIVNCSFMDNIVKGNGKTAGGGAIFWSSKSGSVVGCSFVNNSGNVSGNNAGGGAIFWNNAGGSVVDCSFVNNSASGGGAIYWMCKYYKDSKYVVNCSFEDNSASGDGGAIYWYAYSKYSFSKSYKAGSVSGSNFVNNYAVGSGDAIFWSGKSKATNNIWGSVSGCSFVKKEICVVSGSVDPDNNVMVFTVGVADAKINNDDAIYTTKSILYNGVLVGVGNVSIGQADGFDLNNISFAVEVYSGDALVDNACLVSDSCGNVTYDYSKLPIGEYRYVAYHTDDGNYNYVEITGNFTRKPIEANVVITVADINYGEYPVVNLTGDVSGNYSLVVDGKNCGIYELNEVNNHQMSITVPVLLNAANDYRVSVEFNGTMFYAPASCNATFNVNKALPKFDVNSNKSEYTYGQDAICSVELPADATGAVTFSYLNNVMGKIDVSQQKSLNLGMLDAGQYIIQVNYAGDNNYRNSTKEFAFKINPADNIVKVSVDDVDYPDDVSILLSADVGGVYTVDINGTKYDVTAGEAKLLKLAAGTYYANIVNESMANYNIVPTNVEFTVNKAVNNVAVNVNDAVLPDDAVVCVRADVDGDYTVVINGTSVVVGVVGGEGNASVALPAAKAYLATTTFVHENYTAKITDAIFNVEKGINNINLTIDDVVYPSDVVVKVNADVGGVYTVDITGKLYNVTSGVGKSIKLAAGSYYATVVGYSSPYYDAVIKNTSFAVKKAVNNIVVNVGDVVLPDNATVCVEAGVDGVYTVMINGSFVDVTVVKGTGNASIALPVGESYIASTTFANENYTANITNAVFDVTKFVNKVFVSVEDVALPDNATICIKADVDGVYAVVFKFYDPVYVTVVNGVGNASIKLYSGLAYHTNTTLVNGENYDSIVTEAEFNVTKSRNGIYLTADDVYYPNNVTIRVTADVDGNYTLDINGTRYSVANNGVVSVKLAPGSYSANIVEYSSPDYWAEVTGCEFTVKKQINDVSVSVSDVVLPDDAVVCVRADVDGDYTVVINGTSVVVSVVGGEGNASVALPAGKAYLATTTFSDHENYTVSIKNAVFDVVKGINTVNVTVYDVSYPNDVFIWIDADDYGSYTVDINGTTFDVMSDDGLSVNLPMGTYYATVVGYSSPYYDAVIKGATFTVGKPTNNIVINVISVVLPENVTIGVNADVDGDYTVVINGTSVVVSVVNYRGNASVHLPAGKSYLANTTFSDHENYTVDITEGYFDVEKGINNINLTVDDVFYPNDVVVRLSADVVGVYVVDINGTKYEIPTISNGVPIENLAPGNYYARVVDYSSEDYDAVINNDTFTVKLLNSVSLSIDNALPTIVIVGENDGSQNSEYKFAGNVVLPENVTIGVKAGVDGVYTVMINGSSVDVDVVGGVGNASIALPAGKSYRTNVTFAHEDYVVTMVSNAEFDVVKGINTINVTVDDGTQNHNATIHVDADIAGVYTVDINGTLYNVTAGVAKSIKLPVGEYYARVVGYSSPYYEAVIRNATFIVSTLE